MNHPRTLFRAAVIADGDSVVASPGAVLTEPGRILAAGTPQTIGMPGDCHVVDLPESAVIPALVNSHCHLDLSHIGPVPFSGDFSAWIDRLRQLRAITDAAIDAATARGVEMSRAGGTAIVGDIAGVSSLQPLRTMRRCGLAGVSYFEVFGVGRRQGQALAAMQAAVKDVEHCESGVVLGLQPHAPYSCGTEVYRAAADLGRPLATHLAETLDEIEFIQFASGPLEQMLKRLGMWDDSIKPQRRHPIEHVTPLLANVPFVAAHLNYVDDIQLGLLAALKVTAAYCPRASAYFGHPHPGHCEHRYREMLERGINVALGTDSVLCLDTADRLSVLDEMRLLYRRDGTPPRLLLRMATINGAAALGFDPNLVTLKPGPIAGLLAIPLCSTGSGGDACARMLLTDEPPQWLLGPYPGQNSWRSG